MSRITGSRIEIRWRDVDASVTSTTPSSLTYLEECRDEWIPGVRRCGELLHHFVLAHVSIDSKRQLRQDDDVVDVSLRLTRVGTSSLTTQERISVAGDGALAAEAEAVLVHIDWESGRSQAIPEALAGRLQALVTS